MKDFGDTANTTGTFPSVECQNISAPGDGLGTPAVYEWVQNLWGWPQALLDYVGETPDGNEETGTASQLFTAMTLLGAVYPGCLVPLHIFSDPGALSPAPRMLLLTGQTVLITDYPELVAACYVGDGNNANVAYTAYFKVQNDGVTRDTAGNKFILPDMRGYTARGYDVAAAVDPDGASRTLADVQAEQYLQHNHSGNGSTGQPIYQQGGAYDGYLLEAVQTDASPGGSLVLSQVVATPSDAITDDVTISTTGNSGGNETRMANVSVNWAIVY